MDVGNDLSILIVDDEKQVCDLVLAAISRRFPEVVTYSANDGAPGLELFQLYRPDLVVTDLAMPGMDGITLAGKIKELEPKTVIVAVTGHTDTDDLLKAIEIGIDHYLLKPSFLNKLYDIITQIIAAKAEMLNRAKLENALRLSEERLLMTILNSPVAVSSQNLDLCYTWVCNSQMGFEADQMLGKTDQELFPEEVVRHITNLKCKAIAECIGVRDEVGLPKDGAVTWYDLTIEPLWDQQGQLAGITNIMVDITKRKLAEEKILDLNAVLERRVRDRTAKLKAAIREQEAFSYTVSHDLRAPLRHINSFSSLLVEDFGEQLPEEARFYLERIRSTARRMGNMIDHLLELSRISRAVPKQERVDLSSVAGGVATMLQETEPERSVDFVIPSGLLVQGDQTLIRQLIQNLFSNSWKYSAGNPQARIELGSTRMNGDQVFFVKDNGVGFDMAHSGQLFSIFQRLHGHEFEGIGIGLAIVHRIIERHSGTIWAEGKVNEGATFYFTFGSKVSLPSHYKGKAPHEDAQLSFPLESQDSKGYAHL